MESRFWSDTCIRQVSASLGLILHPKADESNSRIAPAPSDMSENSSFLNRIPGLSRVLPYLTWDRKNVTDILSFRLLHDPWKKYLGPPLPEIRLEFEITSSNEDERHVELKGLYAIRTDIRGQVMLPSQAVDLCFKRKETYHAGLNDLESQPEIRQFIEQTRANVLDGSGTLRTPATVRLHLPFSVIGKRGRTLSHHSIATKSLMWQTPKNLPVSEDLSEIVDETGVLALYHFIGVEHLQTAGYTFEGYPVRYTSVEAGKLGGCYGDLEILMASADGELLKHEKGISDVPHQAFIEVALKLVNLVDKAAHGKLERPGQLSQPAMLNLDIDQEGMKRWIPEHVAPKTPRSSTWQEAEIDGTEERVGDEQPDSNNDHTTILTLTEPDGTSVEASPITSIGEVTQSIVDVSVESFPGKDAITSTKPLNAGESETTEPEERTAASG